MRICTSNTKIATSIPKMSAIDDEPNAELEIWQEIKEPYVQFPPHIGRVNYCGRVSALFFMVETTAHSSRTAASYCTGNTDARSGLRGMVERSEGETGEYREYGG